MSQPKYPRGSEWRKWDLQVHTPFSALNNGFGDNFEDYAKCLIQEAIQKHIAAIGITDYFSIEGYKRLKELLSNQAKLKALIGAELADQVKRILIIPNIELRTSVIVTRPDGTDSRVNFHVLFSDDVDLADIEEHFFRELKFTAESNPARPDERWSLTHANLENLGKKLKAQHAKFQGKSDLYVGMMTAIVAHEDVTRVLETQASRFKDRYLILIPSDEDLSECNWNGQGHLARKLLIQKSHMLFSANAGTREFGLGRKHTTVQEFTDEFKSLKPCIHSSDSHDYASLFEPAEKRYTWIKADPTFQGLRQVLNEPEDRVFIGIVPPSIERVALRPTRVVDSVSIKKIQGTSFSEKWFDCDVALNPELVAIIGNKGNGKSALADVLGLLGSTPRYRSFSFLREDRFRESRNNKAKHFQGSLTWTDKNPEGPIRLDSDPEPETVEKIRYIPQNYLEEICNEVGLGKGSRFYAELQQVIFSHVPESDRLGFDTLDDLLDYRSSEISRAIDILVSELREINKQIVAQEERLTTGFRRSLDFQLAERRRELQAHDQAKPKEMPKPEVDPVAQQRAKEASEALEGKQKVQEQLVGEIAKERETDGHLAKKRASGDRLLARLKNLQRQVEGTLTESSTDFNELGINIDQVVSFKLNVAPIEALLRNIDSERAIVANRLDKEEKDSLESRRIAVTIEIEELKNKLTAPQREYQTYLQKLGEWTTAREKIIGSTQIIGSVSHLESQLSELNELPKALQSLYRKRDRKTLEIYAEKKKLRGYYESCYGAVQDFLSKHPLTAGEQFKVTFNVAIVQAGFSDSFLARIDQRKVGAFAGVDDGAAALKRLLDATKWNSALSTLRFTRKLLKQLIRHGDLKLEIKDQLKQGELLQDLYDDISSLGFLSPIYRLTWEGKGLEQLSPGERGNLLLIFYLLVDRDDIPLVIDQPEENLDNQTVVRTLVPCMKDAKKRRQIVMVTHNPNLAVVCDAEQVIYAEIRKELDNEVAYISGSIEDPVINKKIVDVLEGTRPAFDKRDAKYLRL